MSATAGPDTQQAQSRAGTNLIAMVQPSRAWILAIAPRFALPLVAVACIAWARATSSLVHIPPVTSTPAALAFLLAGTLTLATGAKHRLVPYPVYSGFCLLCFGVSIAAGSASGVWLVSPLVTLILTAWVLGAERHHHRRRFDSPPVRILPPPTGAAPTAIDRVNVYLFLLAPWLTLYEAVLALGIPAGAVSGVTHWEARLPVIQWTQIFYGSTYFVALAVPFFAKTRAHLRRFLVDGYASMLIAYPAFVLIPLIAPKRSFVPSGIPGHLLMFERSLDSPVAAFPSFHVTWAILAAAVYAKRWPRLQALFYGWTVCVCVSCVTTSQHSILDVAGGLATIALIRIAPRIARANGRVPWAFIFWNLAIAAALLRLWFLHAPQHLIAGLFLILAGLGVFVEAGGRPRQRIAVSAVTLGILLTAIGPSG